MLKIKVRLLNSNVKLPKVIHNGEWIDLVAAEDIYLNAPQAGTLKKHKVNGIEKSHRDVSFEYALIPLGISMRLPKGYEAYILPRSSTFKKYGIMEVNSQGIIDNSYCGNNDEWQMPVIALRDTCIPAGSRICQFRIQLSQKATFWQKIKWLFTSGILIEEVKYLNNDSRGGFGSTGV